MLSKNVFGKRLLFLALIFSSLSYLFPNHYLPWPGFYNEFPMGLALFSLSLYIILQSAGDSWRVPAYSLAVFAVALLPLFQFAAGIIYFSGDGWLVFLYLAASALSVVMGHKLASMHGHRLVVNGLAIFFVSISVVSGFLALRQVFQQSGVVWEVEIPYGGRATANLAQPNQLSSLLLIGLLFANYLRAIRGGSAAVFFVVLIPIVLGIATAQSRASLLISFFMVLACFVSIGGGCSTRRFLRHLKWTATVVVIVWFCWSPLYGGWLDPHGKGEVRELLVDQSRMAIWRAFVEAAIQKPWLGYGWNQISVAQMEVVKDFPVSVVTNSAHNVILDLFLWCGVPIGSVIVFCWLKWFVLRRSRLESVDHLVLYSVLLVLGTHSLFEFPLAYSYFLIPAFFIVGIFDANDMEVNLFGVRTWSLYVVILLLLVLYLNVVFDYFGSENRIRSYRYGEAGLSDVSKIDVLRDGNNVLSQLSALEDIYAAQFGKCVLSVDSARMSAYRFPFPQGLKQYMIVLRDSGSFDQLAFEVVKYRGLYGEKRTADLLMELKVPQ